MRKTCRPAAVLEEQAVTGYEIIDFHTHPFTDDSNNICAHIANCDMSVDNTRKLFDKLGVSKICGSVICRVGHGTDVDASEWDAVKKSNDTALLLREKYGDFYVPGFHVHPGYIKESCEEIERMAGLGVKLIGELVPYMHGWGKFGVTYSSHEFDEILDTARFYGMAVSFHSQDEDCMDEMVKKHKDIVFIAAHPGEYGCFMRHMERMKYSDNYYLDVSGTGIFRHGMLRHAIDLCGKSRIIFGSDYPTCNPAMFIGAVLLDTLITDDEKRAIFSENIKTLLGI